MQQENNATTGFSYKTGWGFREKNAIGWVAGWIEENVHVYPFVLNIEGPIIWTCKLFGPTFSKASSSAGFFQERNNGAALSSQPGKATFCVTGRIFITDVYGPGINAKHGAAVASHTSAATSRATNTGSRLRVVCCQSSISLQDIKLLCNLHSFANTKQSSQIPLTLQILEEFFQHKTRPIVSFFDI